jgi:hypothetical protein
MLGVKVITLWEQHMVSPFNQPLENALVSDEINQNTNFGIWEKRAMRTIPLRL